MTTVNDNGTAKQQIQTVADSNKKTDGFANIYTREGVQGADKSTGFSFAKEVRLSEETVRQQYRSNGFAKKIVDRPVNDMTREWFDIIGDSDGEFNVELARIKSKKQTKIALTWAKVYGGSLMLMGIDDGGQWEDELNEENIKKVEFLKVYDRYRITWETGDLYDDAEKEKYGTPELYTVTPIEGNIQSFKVHETRILRFDGPLTDTKTFNDNNSWNESVFQGVQTELTNLNSVYAAVKSIIDDFIQIIIKVENLQQMVAAGQDDLVKQRLNIIDLGRHIMNTIMLDGKEEYTKEASSVAGLNELIHEFQTAYSAVTDIPMTVLFGTSPKGLSATGKSDITLYYDEIAASQEDDMLDQMERLTKLLMLQKEGPTNGTELENWAIDFNSLWQPTESETAETRKTVAETDKIYVEIGVLKSTEVAISRFGGDRYSMETEINEADHKEGGLLNPDGSLVVDPETQNPEAQVAPKIKQDAYHGKKRILRINNRTKKQVLKQDEMTVIEDISGIEKDHSHRYMIVDVLRGNGWTGVGGLDNHSHRIEGGTCQPFEDKDGTTHMHTLPKVK